MTFAVLKVGERLGLREIGFEIPLLMPVRKAPQCADKTSGREPQGKEDVHGDDSGIEDDTPVFLGLTLVSHNISASAHEKRAD